MSAGVRISLWIILLKSSNVKAEITRESEILEDKSIQKRISALLYSLRL